MMRRIVVAAVIGVGLWSLAGSALAQNVSSPAKARATAPDIPFDSVPNFFKLPAGLYMGEGTGIA
ncbi:MAG: hypothetical protein ABMA15_30860, partial [Vicinamibacterales bacterium]